MNGYKRKVKKSLIPTCNIMGVNIAAINMEWLVEYLEKNIADIKGDYICVCGACINICPKDCISYLKKETGTKVAVINKNRCINCHLCKKVCPQLDTVEGSKSFACYAAWSLDDNPADFLVL